MVAEAADTAARVWSKPDDFGLTKEQPMKGP
jgi:hypothetical protein